MPNKVFYTDHFKWLSVGIFCFSLFVLYAALHASEDQTLIAYLVAGFFLAGSAYLLYQAFFVFFEYDDDALYFGSKRKKLEWTRLIEKGYSSWRDMNYVTFEGSGTIWISSYMYGVEDFNNFLEQKTRMLDEEWQRE
jgi:hypothetical protein